MDEGQPNASGLPAETERNAAVWEYALHDLPDGISDRTKSILMAAVFRSSAEVGRMFGVTAGHIRRLICENRGVYDQLRERRNLILASVVEDGLWQMVNLVSKGLGSQEPPDTGSQTMAMVQAAQTYHGLLVKLRDSTAQEPTTPTGKRLAAGVLNALKTVQQSSSSPAQSSTFSPPADNDGHSQDSNA